LAGRVPDGEFDAFVVEFEVLYFKVYADGGLDVFVKGVVGEAD
jgi:hypothetical protein